MSAPYVLSQPAANAFGLTNGTSPVTMLTHPGRGALIKIADVTVHNSSGGAVNVFLEIVSASSGSPFVVDSLSGVASLATYHSADRIPVIVLDSEDESLRVRLGGAGSFGWSIHYTEERAA